MTAASSSTSQVATTETTVPAQVYSLVDQLNTVPHNDLAKLKITDIQAIIQSLPTEVLPTRAESDTDRLKRFEVLGKNVHRLNPKVSVVLVKWLVYREKSSETIALFKHMDQQYLRQLLTVDGNDSFAVVEKDSSDYLSTYGDKGKGKAVVKKGVFLGGLTPSQRRKVKFSKNIAYQLARLESKRKTIREAALEAIESDAGSDCRLWGDRYLESVEEVSLETTRLRVLDKQRSEQLAIVTKNSKKMLAAKTDKRLARQVSKLISFHEKIQVKTDIFSTHKRCIKAGSPFLPSEIEKIREAAGNEGLTLEKKKELIGLIISLVLARLDGEIKKTEATLQLLGAAHTDDPLDTINTYLVRYDQIIMDEIGRLVANLKVNGGSEETDLKASLSTILSVSGKKVKDWCETFLERYRMNKKVSNLALDMFKWSGRLEAWLDVKVMKTIDFADLRAPIRKKDAFDTKEQITQQLLPISIRALELGLPWKIEKPTLDDYLYLGRQLLQKGITLEGMQHLRSSKEFFHWYMAEEMSELPTEIVEMILLKLDPEEQRNASRINYRFWCLLNMKTLVAQQKELEKLEAPQ